MLLLTETTDKLQLVTGSAATVDVHASFMDASDASPPVVDGASSGRQHTAITTATTTDIVAVPAANRTRNVKTLHVRNKHATTSTDVTVVFDQNATDFELYKTNLAPGEALEYVEGVGFFEVSAIGSGVTYVRKSADQTFAATTFADVTGMGFAVSANSVWEFEYDVIWTSATVTVGVGVAINGPASPTSINGTAAILGGNPQAAVTDNAFLGFTAYDTGPLSTTAPVINTNYVARVACLVEVGGTAGTVILRWRSETATNTTVKAGTYGTAKRLA